jgi:hypothetical protein
MTGYFATRSLRSLDTNRYRLRPSAEQANGLTVFFARHVDGKNVWVGLINLTG